ncbi:MAG: ABC transporter permease [Bacillus sp. (in: firmicutes)]
MTFSMKRVQAIFTKDYKDLMKNYFVLSTPFFALLLAAWLGRTGGADTALIGYVINFTLGMSAIFIQASIVAEEKEKNTLRGLLLSPASTAEIMLGKSLLSALVTIITIVAAILLADYEMPNIWWFSIVTLLCLITYIALGTIVGLLSRSVMEASVVGMPFLLVFGAASMFTGLIDNEILLAIVTNLPSSHFIDALVALDASAGFESISKHVIALLIWVVVSIIATLAIYKKRRFD